jgi:porin
MGCRERFAHRAITLVMLAIMTLGATAAARARTTWLGPGDVCAPDKLFGSWGGVRTKLADYGISFGLQEQTEVWGNLAGGIKQGTAYDGLTTADLCIDLDTALHWQGATIYAYGFQIWGPGPTDDYVGALQLISSIEAKPSSKLYDLWFEQQLFDQKLAIRFGQEGLDDEFMAAPYDALFLNSSFTYPGLAALDLPSGGPAYPLAAPFARVLFAPTKEVTLISGVFTADPAPPGSGDPQLRDRHGTAFRLDDHALSITEVSYSPASLEDRGLPGVYKIGMWIATGPFADPLLDTDGVSLANPATNGTPLTHAGDYAFYAIANQTLWHKPKTDGQRIGVFLNIMHAPDDRNLISLFITGGMNWQGPFPGRSNDVAGVALTYAGLSAAARRYSRDVIYYTSLGAPYAQGEAIIEGTYLVQLTPWFSLQPDLQYVINPGAGIPTPQAPTPLKNDLIVGMRMTVNF